MEIKLRIKVDKGVLEGDGNSILEKIITGVKGRVKLKTPFGDRDVKIKEDKAKKS